MTISTFASGFRHMDAWGGQFGLLVVDEVHHFGGGRQAEALEMCTAPWRLGLTATPPEREQVGARERLARLVGEVVYTRSITEMAGSHLAPFERVRLLVDLSPGERAAYETARERFLGAYRALSPTGGRCWPEFVAAAVQSAAGRRALMGFFESRRVVSTCAAKLERAERLLHDHPDERALLFTADNAAAYAASRRLLIPAITCDIGRAERTRILAQLGSGAIQALVSSRVLNEGIDIPEASVGIVLGGNLGSQEHVQRVGRLLRPRPGKRALVVELVARGTYEVRHARERQVGLVS